MGFPARNDLSVEYVRSALAYDPETGILRWKERADRSRSWNIRYVGTYAGAKSKQGYLMVKINGIKYFAHRLVWVISYGCWPEQQIDHKDGDKLNNRISNIRLATSAQNNQNKNKRRDNTSGHPGVYWYHRHQKWGASIRVDGKQINLGFYVAFEDAVFKRKCAETKYFGEFRKSIAPTQPPREYYERADIDG